MENFLQIIESDCSTREERVQAIVALEDAINSLGLPEMELPIKHYFGDGVYVREMTAPEGALIVGHMHAKAHVFMLLQGSLTIASEDGVMDCTAPCTFSSKAGTKRVIFAHEDSVLSTAHPNPKNSTSEAELKEELIVPREKMAQFRLEYGLTAIEPTRE